MTFEEWFTAQYGKMPSNDRKQKAQEEILAYVNKINEADRIVEEERVLLEAMMQALYAQQAKNNKNEI